MTTIERHVGRLVEIRARGPRDPRPMFGRVFALANELGTDSKVILCIDARETEPVAADEVARIRNAQLAGRGRVELLLTVVGDNPLLSMQAARINEGLDKKIALIAKTPAEAVELLQPILTAAELARLKQFLG
jgi:hypothetical protein